MKKLLALTLVSFAVSNVAQAGALSTAIKAGSKTVVKNTESDVIRLANAIDGGFDAAKGKMKMYSNPQRAIEVSNKDGLKISSKVESHNRVAWKGDNSDNKYRYFVEINLENVETSKRLLIQDKIYKNHKWLDQGQSYKYEQKTNAVGMQTVFEVEGAPRLITIEPIRSDAKYMTDLSNLLLDIQKIASQKSVLTRKAAAKSSR